MAGRRERWSRPGSDIPKNPMSPGKHWGLGPLVFYGLISQAKIHPDGTASLFGKCRIRWPTWGIVDFDILGITKIRDKSNAF